MDNQAAIRRYEIAHERAFPPRGNSTYVIPFQVMRDYLDALINIKREAAGRAFVAQRVGQNGY